MKEIIVIYVFCTLGVIISIVLPVLRQYIIKPKRNADGSPSIWDITKPYIATGAFALLVAFLVVAFMQDQITDWRVALLAGYASDSTLQKLMVNRIS